MVAPSRIRQTAIGGFSVVASYDMLGEQLYHSSSLKHEKILAFAAFACVDVNNGVIKILRAVSHVIQREDLYVMFCEWCCLSYGVVCGAV